MQCASHGIGSERHDMAESYRSGTCAPNDAASGRPTKKLCIALRLAQAKSQLPKGFCNSGLHPCIEVGIVGSLREALNWQNHGSGWHPDMFGFSLQNSPTDMPALHARQFAVRAKQQAS